MCMRRYTALSQQTCLCRCNKSEAQERMVGVNAAASSAVMLSPDIPGTYATVLNPLYLTLQQILKGVGFSVVLLTPCRRQQCWQHHLQQSTLKT